MARGETADATRRLTELFHHRWSVPILAEFDGAPGVTVAMLVYRLGGSVGAIRQALDWLVNAGWVRRVTGHGHPLRPEYVPTKRGRALAPATNVLLQALADSGEPDVVLRKWTVPDLLGLAEGPRRFSDLRAELPDVTDRALSMILRELEARGFVTRHVGDDTPPSVTYMASAVVGRLEPSIRALSAAME